MSSSEQHEESKMNEQELWKTLKEGKEDIEKVPLQALKTACLAKGGECEFPSEFRPQLWKRWLNITEESQLEDVFERERIEETQKLESDKDKDNEEMEKPERRDKDEDKEEIDRKGKKKTTDDAPSRVKEDIAQLMQKHESLEFDADVAEEIVMRFCQSKNMEYRHEILLLLLPFLPLMETDAKSGENGSAKNTAPLTKLEVYHCLSSLVQQYAPLWHASKSDSGDIMILHCFHALCRLILQYHDPLLSMHFDKHRITPDVYVQPWINTLFTTQCTTIPVVTSLWDQFIKEGDLILPLFFGITMLISRRDGILKAASETEILEQLNSINIDERTDAMDILQSAQDLDKETPLSARNQAYTLMLSSPEANFSALYDRLSSNVVLSVPTEEIVEGFRKESIQHPKSQPAKSIHYIVIDCRSLNSFSFARLPTAVHVGPQIGYDDDKMQAILDRFSSARGSHFTIFGTGKRITEEINLLKVIAMKFVSSGFQHISVAPNGFKDCIKYIVSNEIEYVRDEQAVEEEKRRRRQKETDARKLIDKETQEQLARVATAVGSKVRSFWNWSKQVATEQGSKVKEQIARTRAGSDATSMAASTTLASSSGYHHPEPPKSAFSLDDDEDDNDIDDDDDLLMDAFATEDNSSASNERAIKIEDLKTLDENVRVFACNPKSGSEQEQQEQRYIVVGAHTIICLRAHPTMLGFGIMCWKRNLSHLLRLAYHKTDKSSLTFVLRGRPEDVMSIPQLSMSSNFQESYRMSDSMDCVKHIQQCMAQLKRDAEPKLQPEAEKQDKVEEQDADQVSETRVDSDSS